MSNNTIDFIKEPIFQSFNCDPFNLSAPNIHKSLNKIASNIEKKNIEWNDSKFFYTNDLFTKSIDSFFENIGELYVLMTYYNNKKNINNDDIEKLKKSYNNGKLNIFIYYYYLIFLSKISEQKIISIKDILELYNDLKKNIHFPDEKKKIKIINSICGEFLSIVLNVDDIESIFENNDDVILLMITSFERDMFNGVMDQKYSLFITYNDHFKKFLDKNTNEEYKLIIKKYCKFILLENKKILRIINEKPSSNKKTTYILNDFIIIKKKYENFMDLFFQDISDDIEDLDKNNTQLRFFEPKQNYEISLNSKEYSILIEFFNYNYYDFYCKLMTCLLILFNFLKYPIKKINNTLLILLDLVHLCKKNISYKFYQKLLYLIVKRIHCNGIVRKIFEIPITQLKILIFLHDMWDFLIEKKINCYDNDYYEIKKLFSFLYEQSKIYTSSNESILFLYYTFILKKAVRKFNYTNDIYQTKKYYLYVYKDITKKKKKSMKKLYDFSKKILEKLENKLQIALINE